VVAGAAGVAAYAALVEPRRLVVRRHRLTLPHWPSELDGLRVGVLSDLHSGVVHASQDALAKWVARMNAEQPDVILLGGDYTDAHPLFGGRIAPDRIAERLAELRAPRGLVAVMGNHDWKGFGAGMWLALKGAGITVLENESVELDGLHVAGLADLRTRRPSVSAALREVPDGEPVILLSHDPDLFPFVPDRVSLTVAGHTHGGQIAIPYLRRPVVPSAYGERFVRGHVTEGGRQMIVSAGLGTSGLPIRLFAPPEILLLELRG
jgi:predicted MPP superfamily phosphohydrolase